MFFQSIHADSIIQNALCSYAAEGWQIAQIIKSPLIWLLKFIGVQYRKSACLSAWNYLPVEPLDILNILCLLFSFLFFKNSFLEVVS